MAVVLNRSSTSENRKYVLLEIKDHMEEYVSECKRLRLLIEADVQQFEDILQVFRFLSNHSNLSIKLIECRANKSLKIKSERTRLKSSKEKKL